MSSTFSLLQNLTGSAPTLATEGLSLKGLTSVTVILETHTPASQTLSGAGTLEAYIWDSFDGSANNTGSTASGAWSRCKDFDLTVTLSGVPRQAFESFKVVGPRAGRVIWVPVGVTVSAGTQVRTWILGHNPKETY